MANLSAPFALGLWPEKRSKKHAGLEIEKGHAPLKFRDNLVRINAPRPPGVTPKDPDGRPMKAMCQGGNL